jgi:hypothetical protein
MPIYLMLSISVPPPSVRDFIVVGGGASFHNVCQGPLFRREPKESSRALCGIFVLGGTGKAEGRRAAGRREDPERVPESAESTYCWSDIDE